MAGKGRIVYPGAFDPPTLGHLDIIQRGLSVFDEVVVAVAAKPGKETLFDAAERVALVRETTAGTDGVTVETYDGLTVDFVGRCEARAILRGIRTMSDFDYESHLALTNRTISEVETVFVMAGARYSFISSSLIKEVARLGGDVSAMVPPCVAEALERKFS